MIPDLVDSLERQLCTPNMTCDNGGRARKDLCFGREMLGFEFKDLERCVVPTTHHRSGRTRTERKKYGGHQTAPSLGVHRFSGSEMSSTVGSAACFSAAVNASESAAEPRRVAGLGNSAT